VLDEVCRADLLSFSIRFPVSLSARRVDGVLVLVLEQLVLRIEIACHPVRAPQKGDVVLVEELVLAGESLHAVGHMPHYRASILPVLLERIPDGAEIFRMLEDHDGEVVLLHLCDVRHPEIAEVVG
jgi:hypothetical protein